MNSRRLLIASCVAFVAGAAPTVRAEGLVTGVAVHAGMERIRRLPFHMDGLGVNVGLRVDTVFPEVGGAVMRTELYGRVGVPMAGAYLRFPTAARVAESGKTFATGNLDLGGYYDLVLGDGLASLVFTLGVAIPTATTGPDDQAANSLAALARINDGILHVAETVAVRASVSLVLEAYKLSRKVGLFGRVDVAADLPFATGDLSPFKDRTQGILRLNAGLGLTYSLLQIGVDFSNVGTLGDGAPSGDAAWRHAVTVTVGALIPLPREQGFRIFRPFLGTTIGIDDDVTRAMKATFVFGLEAGFI